MRFLQIACSALAWICVGTVALQGAVVTAAFVNGQISLQKIDNIVAAVYGVDDLSIQHEIESAGKSEDSEQPSYDEIVTERWLARMDLDLREISVDKALIEGFYLRQQLEKEKDQYDELRGMFDEANKVLAGAAQDDHLLEVARTLVALPPKLAKDEVLRWLSDDQLSTDHRSMNDLVTIIKSMPLDKRKKILVEFKAPDEVERLGDILQKIRLGVPSVDLIRKTREQLHQFDSNFNPGGDDGDVST